MLWSIWAQYTRLGIVHPSPAFHSCESHSSANIGQSTLRVNVIRVISIVEYHHNWSTQINLIYKKVPLYCFALCTSDFVWHKTKLDLIGMRDDVSSVVVKGWAYRVLGGQGVDLQGPKGSTVRFDGSFDDLEGRRTDGQRYCMRPTRVFWFFIDLLSSQSTLREYKFSKIG